MILSVLPRIGDWLIDQIALGTVGAEKLDFLVSGRLAGGSEQEANNKAARSTPLICGDNALQ